MDRNTRSLARMKSCIAVCGTVGVLLILSCKALSIPSGVEVLGWPTLTACLLAYILEFGLSILEVLPIDLEKMSKKKAVLLTFAVGGMAFAVIGICIVI